MFSYKKKGDFCILTQKSFCKRQLCQNTAKSLPIKMHILRQKNNFNFINVWPELMSLKSLVSVYLPWRGDSDLEYRSISLTLGGSGSWSLEVYSCDSCIRHSCGYKFNMERDAILVYSTAALSAARFLKILLIELTLGTFAVEHTPVEKNSWYPFNIYLI